MKSREATASAWAAFASATATSFDDLITALGRPDLKSTSVPVVTVPDSEISLFTAGSGGRVVALLLEGSEPFPWQRIWDWFEITPINASERALSGHIVLWNADGTRGLIVLQGHARGTYQVTVTFQGNIGAEAPCITTLGTAVTELSSLGSLALGGRARRRARA